MTEKTGNELANQLFARIQHQVSARGVDIRAAQEGHALRLTFADGQRVIINLDPNTHHLWMATRAGGIEFIYQSGSWFTHDKREFFAHLQETIEQTIRSNSLNSRAPSLHSTYSEPISHIEYAPAAPTHWLRNSFILLLATLLGFWAALRISHSPENTPTTTQARPTPITQSGSTSRCESGFPVNGSISLFPNSTIRTDVPNDPELTLNNNHAHPLLLIITAPQSLMPLASILIHARQSTTLHLPSGQYEMLFSSGDTWCNPHDGFSGGHMLKFNQPLIVQSGKPMQLSMQSSGASASDFQLFVKTIAPEEALTPPPHPTFTGDGSMEVQRHANGHFYLPGTIANAPVTFMVDTGASITSISSDLARQAGIHNCKEVQFQTANGTATGCIALVPKMTLGNFALENITIAVMPNLEINLLGANVLRNFQVSQSDSMMLLGRK